MGPWHVSSVQWGERMDRKRVVLVPLLFPVLASLACELGRDQTSTLASALEQAERLATLLSEDAYVAEFVELVRRAKAIEGSEEETRTVAGGTGRLAQQPVGGHCFAESPLSVTG
jgi:hypothetical protein